MANGRSLWQDAPGTVGVASGKRLEEDHISLHGSATAPPGRRPTASLPLRNGAGGTGDGPSRASLGARISAAVALVAALAVVALIVLGGGGSYTVHALFANASGLVNGDEVLVGPAQAGTVDAIGLTSGGAAEVTMSLDGSVAPLHQGTVARIYEDSLSGIASKYVELELAASGAPAIPDGGVIGLSDTYSAVNLDQVFDAFDPLTRAGLAGFIRGEAASLKGSGKLANRALEYLAPGLQSTSRVTAELAGDQPTFDQLVVRGSQAMQALASRSQQLSQLIANTSTATAAIAGQSRSLEQALSLFPQTLTRSATTFAGLRTTLDTLDPLVAASKPAVRRLPLFLTRLRSLIANAVPTVAALDGLIHASSGTGDLTSLATATPGLERVARAAFPELVKQFTASRDQLDYLRNYTPDVVGALSNLGQAGAYYDANGHYLRTQPDLFPFAIDGANQLTTQFPSQRYAGLRAAGNRCPGAAVQATPDGSAPQAVAGCSTTAVLPGP